MHYIKQIVIDLHVLFTNFTTEISGRKYIHGNFLCSSERLCNCEGNVTMNSPTISLICNTTVGTTYNTSRTKQIHIFAVSCDYLLVKNCSKSNYSCLKLARKYNSEILQNICLRKESEYSKQHKISHIFTVNHFTTNAFENL